MCLRNLLFLDWKLPCWRSIGREDRGFDFAILEDYRLCQVIVRILDENASSKVEDPFRGEDLGALLHVNLGWHTWSELFEHDKVRSLVFKHGSRINQSFLPCNRLIKRVPSCVFWEWIAVFISWRCLSSYLIWETREDDLRYEKLLFEVWRRDAW